MLCNNTHPLISLRANKLPHVPHKITGIAFIVYSLPALWRGASFFMENLNLAAPPRPYATIAPHPLFTQLNKVTVSDEFPNTRGNVSEIVHHFV